MIAVIIVDHGSREAASNEMFEATVARWAARHPEWIVIAAHMELASLSIGEAFDQAVRRGATEIIVHPYFLLPGRHSQSDIPSLVEEAAARHPAVKWKITPPLGESEHLLNLVDERVAQTMELGE